MTLELFEQHWLTNTLLNDGFITQKAKDLASKPVPRNVDAWLEANFDPKSLAARNEAQLEEKFIAPLLTQLGWHKSNQEGITVQGRFAKPDYCLVLSHENEDALIATKDHRLIAAICESKAWDKKLDTGKADTKNNPHHQLQSYLSTLRVRFGFLTNGRLWRMYDTDKITAKKTYIEFDLEKICALENADEKNKALVLFSFFFSIDTYLESVQGSQKSPITHAIAESADFTLAVEENLKAVIYGYAGEDSLFELMGHVIFMANKEASLPSIYENSVVLLFRLLFVVYFEDKNADLLKAHPYYRQFSLNHIYQSVHGQTEDYGKRHDGVYAPIHRS